MKTISALEMRDRLIAELQDRLMIKDYITGQCRFKYYRDHQLWYTTENGFLFPVPIEDIGHATFHTEEKGLLMMRYIRKWLNERDSDVLLDSVETRVPDGRSE